MKINSAVFKLKFTKVLYIAAFWIFVSLYLRFITYLLFLRSSDPFNRDFTLSLVTNTLAALIAGLIFGTFEMFYFKDRFRKKTFIYAMLMKSAFYLSGTVLAVFIFFIVYNIFHNDLSIFDSNLYQLTFSLILKPGSLIIFAVWGAILLLTIFFIQVSDRFGQGILHNFLLGGYHNPKEEKRIFMFLDLKSSTTIAEKFGHKMYFNLLNDFFYDITDSIIYNKGEVYQYVGDEVTITWKLNKGIENVNCLKCFFDIIDVINENSDYYLKNYELVPEFKAGLHSGTVTAGEVGIFKKEIVYSGDVLNTASRIQEICNEYEKKLLVSEKLLKLLDIKNKYEAEVIDELKLKGKAKTIKLFSIERLN